jgi:hypothetical protein
LCIQHQGVKPPPTYNRGKDQIDFILTTPKGIESAIWTGIFPYNSIFLSDHRVCYIDLDSVSLFNETMPTIAPPKYRGLRMHDPRIVTKYIDILEKHISYHRLEPKISSLYHMAKNNDWTTFCMEAYEKIDRLLIEGM